MRNRIGKTASLKKYWTQEQDQAFVKLKRALANIQTLRYYDVKDRTKVMAEASPFGLGAVLIKIDSKGPRIIAYGNKSLTECEKRYCKTEKEGLALVWAFEHFKIFLFGKEFELITDHNPLEFIFGPKSKPCASIERCVLGMQSYKYKILQTNSHRTQ